MKYSSLHHTGVRTFSVRKLNGGTNVYDLPCNVADNQLTHCSNVWYENGQLKTRPGLDSSVDNILFQSSSDTDYGNFTITDTVFYIAGEYKQIAVANVCKNDSYIYSYIYFIGTDKSVIPAGHLVSDRISDSIFYTPSNMLFYVGTPTSGGGIYLLLTMQNKYDADDKYYSIYEINLSMNGWTRVDNYYIPTVYINGRGNKYEQAKATNQAYTGVPRILESPNMLNGKFHAYFTSDGCSSCFRLPFSEISGAAVVCRIYHTVTNYVEWLIPSGQTTDTKTFFNAQVTLTIDRQKGIAYFTDTEGEYPIPMMLLYHENNIRITAFKEIKNGFDDVVSSKCCTTFDSRIVFSGGMNAGKAYCSSFSNPLYFPQNSVIEIGDGDREVSSLEVQDNYILAFKKSEIYALKLSLGKAENTNSLLADNDSVFYSSDKLKVSIISNSIGCSNRKTISKCGNQVVWLGSDGNVYTLRSVQSNEIYELSRHVKSDLDKFSQQQLMSAFAISGNSYYLLMIGKKALIMEYTVKEIKCPQYECSNTSAEGIKWYIWNFPDDISIESGMGNDGVIQFLCLGMDRKICYVASLGGETDNEISLSESVPALKTLRIGSNITTKKFDFGSLQDKKNIENIFLSLSGKGNIEIKLNGRHFSYINSNNAGYEFDAGDLKSIRLITRLNGVKSVYITVLADDTVSFGDITIYYR